MHTVLIFNTDQTTQKFLVLPFLKKGKDGKNHGNRKKEGFKNNTY